MDSKSMRLMHLMRMFALNHSVTADMVLALLRILGNGCMPSKEVCVLCSIISVCYGFGNDDGQVSRRFMLAITRLSARLAGVLAVILNEHPASQFGGLIKGQYLPSQDPPI